MQCHSLFIVFTGIFLVSRGPSSFLEWSVPVRSQHVLAFLGRSDPPVIPSHIPTITSAAGISRSQKAMWWSWPSSTLTWSHLSPASMTMLRYVHGHLGQGVPGDGNPVATTCNGPLHPPGLLWCFPQRKGKELKIEKGGASTDSSWLGDIAVWSRLNLRRLHWFHLNFDRSKQTRRTWADIVAGLGQPQAITREEGSLYLRGTRCY